MVQNRITLYYIILYYISKQDIVTLVTGLQYI